MKPEAKEIEFFSFLECSTTDNYQQLKLIRNQTIIFTYLIMERIKMKKERRIYDHHHECKRVVHWKRFWLRKVDKLKL